MHFLPWRFRSFLFSKVQVELKSYLSRPGIKTTQFSLLMSSGVNTCGQTDSAQVRVTLPSAGQCSEGTWSINYVSGNLFDCPKDESLAHCISEDCRMGAGIAVMFKKKFDGVADLKRQSKQVGQCAVLERDGRFVYYLITKTKYNHKPTYANLKQSLEDMRSHCAVNGVSKVSMPRIGCGLDKLEWKNVSEILKEVFGHSNISITVYSLPEKTETTVMKENARLK